MVVILCLSSKGIELKLAHKWIQLMVGEPDRNTGSNAYGNGYDQHTGYNKLGG